MRRARSSRAVTAAAALAALVACWPLRGEDTRTITVTKADCARLVKHVPAPGTTYEPGVDVRGEPVAPADLDGGGAIELPAAVTIPIEVDLFDRLNLPPDRRYEGDARVGTVRVDLESGRARFNGQPLTSEAQAELARKCQRAARGE